MRIENLIKFWSFTLLLSNSALATEYVVKFPGNLNQKSPFYTIDRITHSTHDISMQDELEVAFKIDFKELNVEDTWQCQDWLMTMKKKLSKDGYDIYQTDTKVLSRNEFKKEYEPKSQGGKRRDIGLCRATFVRRDYIGSPEMVVREAMLHKFNKVCVRGENGRLSSMHASASATWPFLRFDSENIFVTPLADSTFSNSTDFMAFAKTDRHGLIEKMIFPTKIIKAQNLLSDEELQQRDLDNARLEYDLIQDTAKVVLSYKDPVEKPSIFSRIKRYVTGAPDPRKEIELSIEACR